MGDHYDDVRERIEEQREKIRQADPRLQPAVDRETILHTAEALINGDRARDYGDAGENFRRIAHGWSSIIGVDVTAVQVALCMDWLKTCRLITSPASLDSWVDKCGYAALGGEIAVNAG